MPELTDFKQLELNQSISSDFLSQSIRQLSKDGETSYVFKSDTYSYPHRLVISSEGKIVEIAVHVPADLRESYLQEMQQLGSPDYSFSPSEYEIQNIFIQAGKLFTLDQSGRVIMVTTASPERMQSVADRIQVKAGQQIEQVEGEEPEATPTNSSAIQQVESSPKSSVLSSNLGAMLIIVGLVGMVVLIGLYLRWKKQSPTSSGQTPPPSIP